MPRSLPALVLPVLLLLSAGYAQECPHWSYVDDEHNNGPASWHLLCDAYAQCQGLTQSPINIPVADYGAPSYLQFHRGATSYNLINNGHTLQMSVDSTTFMEFVDPYPDKTEQINKMFAMFQLHFHSPSEHEINGVRYPLEVHMVHHRSDDISIFAVVGMVFEEGDENPFLAQFWDEWPVEEGQQHTGTGQVNMRDFLYDKYESFWHYRGSFTTPPCTPGVEWFVLQEKQTASAAQIAFFQSLISNNSRPVQALNDRSIQVHFKSAKSEAGVDAGAAFGVVVAVGLLVLLFAKRRKIAARLFPSLVKIPAKPSAGEPKRGDVELQARAEDLLEEDMDLGPQASAAKPRAGSGLGAAGPGGFFSGLVGRLRTPDPVLTDVSGDGEGVLMRSTSRQKPANDAAPQH